MWRRIPVTSSTVTILFLKEIKALFVFACTHMLLHHNNSPVFFVGDEAPERIHYLRIFRATAIAPSRARATRQNKLRFLNIADIVFGVA